MSFKTFSSSTLVGRDGSFDRQDRRRLRCDRISKAMETTAEEQEERGVNVRVINYQECTEVQYNAHNEQIETTLQRSLCTESLHESPGEGLAPKVNSVATATIEEVRDEVSVPQGETLENNSAKSIETDCSKQENSDQTEIDEVHEPSDSLEQMDKPLDGPELIDKPSDSLKQMVGLLERLGQLGNRLDNLELMDTPSNSLKRADDEPLDSLERVDEPLHSVQPTESNAAYSATESKADADGEGRSEARGVEVSKKNLLEPAVGGEWRGAVHGLLTRNSELVYLNPSLRISPMEHRGTVDVHKLLNID